MGIEDLVLEGLEDVVWCDGRHLDWWLGVWELVDEVAATNLHFSSLNNRYRPLINVLLDQILIQPLDIIFAFLARHGFSVVGLLVEAHGA